MGKAKEIIVKVIPSKVANAFVKKWHYSGKVVNNSKLHFGAFLNGVLHGVMSFGSPMDKRKVLPLVVNKKDLSPAEWHGMLELNRMAFDEVLPRNSESRCIAIACKLIRKQAPQIKWILSFSDGTQCGDGTIYRASGFDLTKITKNKQILLWNEKLIAKKTLDNKNYPMLNGKYFSRHLIESGEATPIDGFQLRYIKILDSAYKLNCPNLPFSKIREMGAGMYKGEKR